MLVGWLSAVVKDGTVWVRCFAILMGITLVCSVCVVPAVDDDESVMSPSFPETEVVTGREVMAEGSKLNGSGASTGTTL